MTKTIGLLENNLAAAATAAAAAAAAILIKHTSFYFFAPAVFSYNHVKCFFFFHLRWINQHTRRGGEAGQPRILEEEEEEEGLSFNFIVQLKQLFKRFLI